MTLHSISDHDVQLLYCVEAYRRAWISQINAIKKMDVWRPVSRTSIVNRARPDHVRVRVGVVVISQ